MSGAIPHRCSRDACRKRVVFARIWDEYKRKKVCSCGCTKFVVDRWRLRRGREAKCNCSGYHFPHRAGSKHCTDNPMSAYFTARDRYGVKGDALLDLFIECSWEAEGGRSKDVVPF